MEQNNPNIELVVEDKEVLENILPRFNDIYKKNILVKDLDELILLFNTEEVSPNDVFTLGGFYGTALFKKSKGL